MSKIQTEILSDMIGHYFPLTHFSVAERLCVNKDDISMWLDDRRAGRYAFTNSAILRLKNTDSVAAPVLKAVASRQLQRVRQDISKSAANLSQRQPFYPRKDFSETPLETFLSQEKSRELFFSPYHLRAAALIEVVRVSGFFFGSRDGDRLALRFMRLILDLGGVKEDKIERETKSVSKISFLDGSFVFKEKEGLWSSQPKELSNEKHYLAITILAAWLRMSSLGVLLFSRSDFEDWKNWLNFYGYGVIESRIGEVWTLSEEKTAAIMAKTKLHGSWASPLFGGVVPWLEDSDGSPNVIVGLVAEVLEAAMLSVGVDPEKGREQDLDSFNLVASLSSLRDCASGCVCGIP